MDCCDSTFIVIDPNSMVYSGVVRARFPTDAVAKLTQYEGKLVQHDWPGSYQHPVWLVSGPDTTIQAFVILID
jgi:hypothetical protein